MPQLTQAEIEKLALLETPVEDEAETPSFFRRQPTQPRLTDDDNVTTPPATPLGPDA
jgi:hypothetical protein